MVKYTDKASLYRIRGQEKPPVPWDEKKGAGMSLGKLLKEDVIDVDDKLV